jgi:WD40 repeat protein
LDTDLQFWRLLPDRTKPAGWELPRRGIAAFSADGTTLAVENVANGGAVELWDVATQSLRRRLPHWEYGVSCLDFSPASDLLAVGHGPRVSRQRSSPVNLWRIS